MVMQLLLSVQPLLLALLVIQAVEGVFPAFFDFSVFFFDWVTLTELGDYWGLFVVCAIMAAGFEVEACMRARQARHPRVPWSSVRTRTLLFELLGAVLAGVLEELRFRWVYIQTTMILFTVVERLTDDDIVWCLGMFIVAYVTVELVSEASACMRSQPGADLDRLACQTLPMAVFCWCAGLLLMASTRMDQDLVVALSSLLRALPALVPWWVFLLAYCIYALSAWALVKARVARPDSTTLPILCCAIVLVATLVTLALGLLNDVFTGFVRYDSFLNPSIKYDQTFIHGVFLVNFRFFGVHIYQGWPWCAIAWFVGLECIRAMILHGLACAVLVHIIYDLIYTVVRHTVREIFGRVVPPLPPRRATDHTHAHTQSIKLSHADNRPHVKHGTKEVTKVSGEKKAHVVRNPISPILRAQQHLGTMMASPSTAVSTLVPPSPQSLGTSPTPASTSNTDKSKRD